MKYRLNGVLGVGGMPVLCCRRWRLGKRLPGGFSIQPALVPGVPLRMNAGHGPFDTFPSVIFVKKRQYHNYIHHNDAIGRDYGDARRCVPSYGEYGLRPGISGYNKNLVPDGQAC